MINIGGPKPFQRLLAIVVMIVAARVAQVRADDPQSYCWGYCLAACEDWGGCKWFGPIFENGKFTNKCKYECMT